MVRTSWLISWIGRTDHEAAERDEEGDVGPIATALMGPKRYDRIYLLTNYPFERSRSYCTWLQNRAAYRESSVDLYQVDLASPIDYGAIYSEVSKNLKGAGLPREDVELTFHLSPGTPAMAAIWIILAKTRFPATLIQTSRERGLEPVDFFFDLANDFLPEFLQRSGDRIERLVSGPIEAAPSFSKIVHASDNMRREIALAQRIAVHDDVPVLILGETGTGKELFAEAIHATSRRAGKPFLAVNCGAISPELANSELFGHKKGAFTGATASRGGHFREADGGTLFLDEVGDLPADTQVRLLRALQSGEVTPVGASAPVKVNSRVIAATHRDLTADVATGRFREDLFHRLAGGILRLPPLRDRGEDVELLIEAFLKRINQDSRGRPETQEKTISPKARSMLLGHPWPGNVRELYHTLVRASIWSTTPEIQPSDVSSAILQPLRPGATLLEQPLVPGFRLQEVLDEVTRTYLARALKQAGGRKSVAASLLGFANYQTLGNRMRKVQLLPDDPVSEIKTIKKDAKR